MIVDCMSLPRWLAGRWWLGLVGAPGVWAWLGATALLVGLGCRGVPTEPERLARREVHQIAGRLHLADESPVTVPEGPSVSLEDYVRFAVLRHPGVRSAWWTWAAAVEQITVERSLPDPRVSFEADVTEILMTAMPGLMQDLPGPGKRKAAALVASAESEILRVRFEQSVLETAFRVRSTFYRIHALEEELTARRQLVELLEGWEAAMRGQSAVNRLSLEEIYRLRNERDRLMTEVSNLEQQQLALRREWQSALGLGPGEAAPTWPAQVESTPLEFPVERLWERAFAQNPGLRRLEAEVRKAAAELALAERAGVPDFNLGLMVDVKSAPLMWRPLAGMSLPLWRDKLDATRARARAREQAAQAAREEGELQLAAELAWKMAEYQELTRNLRTLQERVWPEIELALGIVRGRFQTGQSDYRELMELERRRLELATEAARVRGRRESLVAELVVLVAGALPEPFADLPSGSAEGPGEAPGLVRPTSFWPGVRSGPSSAAASGMKQ